MSETTTARGATLKDVAKRAGVNKASASVVLNGARSNTGISAATREKIMQAARELNYTPNAVARSLTRRKTGILGFYSGSGFLNARNSFLSEVIGGLQEGCDKYSKDLLLYGAFAGRTEDDVYRGLTNGNVDGLVLLSPPQTTLIEAIAASHLPAVAIADYVPALPSVVVDEVAGSKLLAEHLHAKGHKNIYYRRTRNSYASVNLRFESLVKAATARGMKVTSGIENLDHSLTREEKDLLLGNSGERPSCVAAWVDTSADMVADFCRENAIKVPGDLAVVGFNRISVEGLSPTRLTTIHAPWCEVAQTAVALLVEQIEGKTTPPITILPVSLTQGDST